MKMKPGTGRIFAFLAALLALAAAQYAAAANYTYKWAGTTQDKDDKLYKYSIGANWIRTDNNATGVPRTTNNAQDNLMFTTASGYIEVGASRTIYFDGKKTNYWKLHVRNAGSEADPIVFTASDGGGITAGANTSKTGEQGFYIAYDTGSAWLRIESGTYDTGNNGYWYIGSSSDATIAGHVEARPGTVLSGKKGFEVRNGTFRATGAEVSSGGTTLVGNGGANGVGTMYLSGGSLTSSSYILVGGTTSAAGTGYMYVDGGTAININGTSNPNLAIAGKEASGEMHVTNSTVTVKSKTGIGWGADSYALLDLNNCTFTSGNIVLGNDNKAIAKATVAGGKFTSSGAILLGGQGNGTSGKADTSAELYLTDGVKASSGGNTEIGNFNGSTTGGYALLSLSGGASYTCDSNLHLGAGSGCIEADEAWLSINNATMNVSRAIYVNGGKGGIAIGANGKLDVAGDSSADIALADGSRSTAGGNFAITLGDGGVLATPGFTFRDRTLSPQKVKLAFEGGTLKAKGDNANFITNHTQLAVTVNANGGIIDTAGDEASFAVTIPASLKAADGAESVGDMTVKGGGSVEFKGNLAFGGNVKVQAGTILKLGDDAAGDLTANGALKIKAVALANGVRPATGDTLVEFSGETTPTDALAKSIAITWDDGADASEDFALEAKGKTIVWKDLAAPTWTGAQDGDFSDAANWKNGLKPSNGSTVYFAATAPVTANNDIEGLSVGQIVFSEGSARATIAGNAIEVTGSVANNSGAAQTISAPVTFTGDITTTMADAASTVTYAGGVTGVKIAASSADERVLRGHYTLTGTDLWPDENRGQYDPDAAAKWTIKSGSMLRVKKANLRNCTIESGATVVAETGCYNRYQYYERVVKTGTTYAYYGLLTTANHGIYKIGALQTEDGIELFPAYSAENYSGGVTIVDSIVYDGGGQPVRVSFANNVSNFGFHLSPGHRVTGSGWAGEGAGVWAVGEGGVGFNPGGATQDIWYRVRGDVTLKSTADWTLYENPSNMPPCGATGAGDDADAKWAVLEKWVASTWVQNQTVASLSIDNGATLTIDTSHFATNGETGVAGHTVTFEGQVAGGADTKVAVTGDGTLFWKARGVKFTGTMAIGAGARLRLSGDGFGFTQLAGLEIAAGGTLEIDPVVKPVSLAQPPAFENGAKIALDPYYAATTLGKFVLLTWTGGDATIPEGLFDASSVAEGATCALAVETAPDGESKQLVLRVGDYENDAKAIRIAPIGDSITEGVGGSDYATYRKSMAALLAARGYKPTLLGAWRKNVYDSAGVRQPEEWLWHTGFSGDAVTSVHNSSGDKGGAIDNLHLYLDIVGIPDAIVLFIGTNDMSGGQKEGDVAYAGWTNLVWQIYNQRPQTKIVAGTAIDRIKYTTTTKRQAVFNGMIRAAYQAGELPPTLSIVDLADYANVPVSFYTTIGNDGTHPNWNGHALIARHFADGVAAALPFDAFEPTTDPTVTNEPQTALGAENIPELAKWRRGFNRAYAIDIAATNGIPTTGDAPYTWTNPNASGSTQIAKVGYYMELVRKGTNRRRWVWVDMDASGKTLDDVDFPWNAATYRQEAVAKLHVKSNDSGIHEIAPTDDTVWGIVEATPYGYSKTSIEIDAGGTKVKNLLEGHGWADTMFSDPANAPYGCFQTHRVFSAEQKQAAGFWHDAETLFAWNRWASTRGDQGDDLGIGPFFCSAAIDGGTRYTADYTHSANKQGNLYDTTGASAYSVRRLEIWYATEANNQRGTIFMVK